MSYTFTARVAKPSTYVRTGDCGYGRCKHQVCVTYRTEGSSTTQNEEAARFVRHTVAELAQTGPGHLSAKGCLHDGDNLLLKGEPVLALSWYLRSLEHSVGVFHPAAKVVAEMVAASTHPQAAETARRYNLTGTTR